MLPQSSYSGAFPGCPFAPLPKQGITLLVSSSGSYSRTVQYLINE